jgi:carbonic anhydrase/acetyltransferase-like protein (isoleucine patch superfamily)
MVVDVVCTAPKFARSEEYSVMNSAIVHRRVGLRGDVETLGSCLVERGAILRGDIAKITLYNCVVIEEDVIVKPPLRVEPNRNIEPVKVTIGTHSSIGKRTVCEAQSIGAFVVIEKDCCVGALSVIGHGAWIRRGSVVPAGTVVEPFFVYEGNPIQPVGLLHPESHALYVKELQNQRMQSLIIG